MSADQWQRAEDLLEQALQRRPEERTAFLAEACGRDVGLQTEVESLLAHDEQASPDFMRPPEPNRKARDQAVWDDADQRIGKKIGRYTIVRLIAAGGMGCVFEATQDQPARSVALKILRPGLSVSSALARFRLEPEVLGRLQHPHIAQVFEAGVHEDERGPMPYFAMELIPDARALNDYADGEKLDLRSRLELFAKVCDAVQHGHQKGIIHRDLKPSNILIGRDGQPKVIDFGVARSTDADIMLTTQCTQAGDLVGTVRYMSPEQCDGDSSAIDTRTDIYSLGVVVYELLTGNAPYDTTGTTIYAAVRVIKDEPPRPPSEFKRRLRGDVEAILLKALEKDPARRYQLATALADDIQRHLDGEPIEARPPTLWHRTLRRVARHPVAATTLTCLTIAGLVIAATYVSVWLLYARPHDIVIIDGGTSAQLVSLNGWVLDAWDPGKPGRIRSADFIGRHPLADVERLALLTFDKECRDPFTAAACAFDVDVSLEDPLWCGRIMDEDVLPELRERHHIKGRQFSARVLLIADIFTHANHPGDEIVARYQHSPWSPCVVRIYDMAGNRLYEFWNDGNVDDCYWMADARTLAFTAINSTARWSERGHPDVSQMYPHVVFAVRPEAGVIVNDAFLPTGPRDDRLAPLWYWCLLPPEAAGHDGMDCRLARPEWANPGNGVRLGLRLDNYNDAAMWWELNEHGEGDPRTRYTNDAYKENRRRPEEHHDRLPDPDDFKLGDLPPIVSKSEGPAESVRP